MAWLLLASSSVSAQLAPPPAIKIKLDLDALPRTFDVTAWETDSGLPQNTVRDVLQTRDGHIWVGTSDGLARFNGTEFTVFNRVKTPGFPNAPLVALLEAPDGSLWIASDGNGVARWHEGRMTMYGVRDGLLGVRVLALALDKDGSIWIGTSAGVNRFKDGHFTRFTEAEGLARNTVRTLCVARSGEVWVGTSRGLSVIKDGTVTTDTTVESLSSRDVRLILESAAGARWVVTNSEVVRQQDGATTQFNVKHGISPQYVDALLEDRNGTMWFGTNDGLFRFERDKFVAETAKGALARTSIRSLHEDRESNLWLGTNDGLIQLRRTAFTAFGADDGLSHNIVASVCQDSSGAYWVGTHGGGLNRLIGGTRTTYKKTNGLLSDSIRALCPGRDGAVWVGFDRAGVVRIKEQQVTPFVSDGILDGSGAQALHEDRNGTLWIGTRNGLWSLKDGRVLNHTKSVGLEGNIIRAFAEDAQGVLWIGTSKGLTRHQDGRFETLPRQAGLGSQSIRALRMDREGVLWIGTNGAGLSLMRDGNLVACTTANGLHNDTVLDILDDERGYLWMTSPQGIFRAAKEELLDFGSGRRSSVDCDAFSKADGIPGAEGTGLAKPAAWRSPGGQIWFATVKGLVSLDPARLAFNETAPPVVITRMHVDGVEVPLGQFARLPPGHGELEFAYAALSYTQPERIRYKYMLEGVNASWVDAGTRQVVNYSRVPPGRHRFHVRAMNNDGVWNLTGATFDFYITPHFYETWWFYSGLAMCACSGAWGVYSLRMRSLRNREAQLVALVHERTAHLELQINERKRAEDALRESEALYQSLVEVLPVQIYRKDKDGRFTFANQHFCTRLTRPVADIVNRTDHDLFPAPLADRRVATDQLVLKTRASFQCEEAETDSDGQPSWCDSLKVPVFDGHGELIGTQGLSWDITPRKRAEQQVAQAQRELIEVSRLAGMAEVATGVLHNVGNVLNSVNVSATWVEGRVRATKIAGLAKVSEMLRQPDAGLASFLASDCKGQAIPGYLALLAEQLTSDQAAVIAELRVLRTNIDHIKRIVAMQQNYAKVSGVTETLAICEVVDEALRINEGALTRHRIELVRDYRARPMVTIEKHKVVQILVNLFENAKHACADSPRRDRRIVVRIVQESKRVLVSVADNGIGIAAENLTRIFAHGFTTRPHGHGFGLHISALAAKDLFGRLTAASEGPGRGAEFVLELPLERHAAEAPATGRPGGPAATLVPIADEV